MAHSPPTDLNRRLFVLYIGTKSKNRKSNHVGINSPVARQHLTFPLLSDADLTVHRLYGAYGEKKLYGKVYAGVIRSTFVIDGDGVIRVARIHPRYSNHERFLEILIQAGSHGGVHRVAKAAKLVYCDVFDRDAQHVGKDKTSSPRYALPSSRLCMADPRTCPEASQLCHKSSLNLFPTMIAAKRTPTWPQSQNLHIEKTRRMIRAVIRNRNIILFLSCNNNHCYVAEAYDYRPSKRFPESLPSC